MKIPAIKHVILLDSPIQRVWQALTTPEEVTHWLGAIGFAPQIGHEFYFQVEPHHLAFTWYVAGLPKTLVTFTLREAGAQTELTLEHTGWDQLPPFIAPIRDELDLGWRDGVLPNLRQHLVESV